MATCKDCIHHNVCKAYEPEEPECFCNQFKNKADFVKVVRCGKCKHGELSCHAKTKDGEETIACYCTIKNKVTDVDYYCPSGERRDT